MSDEDRREDIRRAEDRMDEHPLRESVEQLADEVQHLTVLSGQLLSTIGMFVRVEDLESEVKSCVHGELEPRVEELERKWKNKLSRRSAVFFLAVIGFAALTLVNVALVLQLADIEEQRTMAIRDALVVSCEQNKQVEDALEGVLRVLAAPRDDDEPGDHDRRLSLLDQTLALIDSQPCSELVDEIAFE